jgi:hypothetical protein
MLDKVYSRQSLYGDKVYTGQCLYKDKVYTNTNFFHIVLHNFIRYKNMTQHNRLDQLPVVLAALGPAAVLVLLPYKFCYRINFIPYL